MNYEKIYSDLINKAKSSNRNKKEGVYEKHHIIPKCLGGGNNKENLVLLTPREHFIAHSLLIKFHSGKEKAKLSFSLFQMCRKNSQHKRIISARQFELAKKLMSENCRGENATFYGRKHTDEAKLKMSKRMMGEKNPLWKTAPWNKNKILGPLSIEQRHKISLANIGNNHSDETKAKISKRHSGVPKTESHKLKISKKLLGNIRSIESIRQGADKLKGKKQKILVCPHCQTSGGITMHRWHFNNCKFKINENK